MRIIHLFRRVSLGTFVCICRCVQMHADGQVCCENKRVTTVVGPVRTTQLVCRVGVTCAVALLPAQYSSTS
jgi:hypothetical protein